MMDTMRWRGQTYDLSAFQVHACNSFDVKVHPSKKTVLLSFTRIDGAKIEYAARVEVDSTIVEELVSDLADGLIALGVPGAIFLPPKPNDPVS